MSLSLEEKNALIMEYYPLVRQISYRLISRYPSCVEADDLITIGVLGLMEAISRYDPENKVSFGAYVRIRIQGAIVDELRKQDWVPRSVRNRSQQLETSRKQFVEENGREPDEEELADLLKISVVRLRELRQGGIIRQLISMDASHGEESPLKERLTAEAPDPQERAIQESERGRIRECISKLSERERQIVELYYYRELNFKEIGSLLGVTESRISQLHSKLKKKLRRELSAEFDRA